MRRAALAGYPIGLRRAGIPGVPPSKQATGALLTEGDWRKAYDVLLRQAASALAGLRNVDLTAELIAHRFTPKSKAVLNEWYDASILEMDEHARVEKRTRFGAIKYVYPPELMREMRGFFEKAIAAHLPGARVLYWT